MGNTRVNKIFALDYEVKVIQDFEDMREYGDLDSITLLDDEGSYIFRSIAEMVSYVINNYYGKLIVFEVKDFDIFFTYLYSQLLVNYTRKVKETNAKGEEVNRRPDIHKYNPDGLYTSLTVTNDKTFYAKVKINETILLFQEIENKFAKTPTQMADISLQDIYDSIMYYEQQPYSKGLFVKSTMASTLQAFAQNRFIEIGGSDNEHVNKENWKTDHPDLHKVCPEVYEAFDEIRRNKRWTKAYSASMKSVKDGLHPNTLKYDVNNMYPSLMCEKKFPYGEAKVYYGFKPEHIKDPMRFLHITMENGYMHCTEDLSECIEPGGITTWMWSFEFAELLRVHPEIKYFVDKSIFFKSRDFHDKQKEYLKSNYKKYKETGEVMYKLLNNTVYGKFSQGPIEEERIPYLNDNGEVRYDPRTLKEPIYPDTAYPPIGSAIVAYGRVRISQTLRNGLIKPEDVLYIDTDCIVINDNEDTKEFVKQLEVGPEFGKWKLELKGEFQSYGIKSYRGTGVNGKGEAVNIEANSGGGKFSEAESFNEETGELVTYIRRKIHLPGGDIRKLEKRTRKLYEV